jgi:hypothetical protein
MQTKHHYLHAHNLGGLDLVPVPSQTVVYLSNQSHLKWKVLCIFDTGSWVCLIGRNPLI